MSKLVESSSKGDNQERKASKKLSRQQKIQTIEAKEDEFIQAAAESFKATVLKKELPTGAFTMKSQSAALSRSIVECTSFLLDWRGSACQAVGYCCKVYWDGEYEWFDARILNYDLNHDKYYVSFLVGPISSYSIFFYFTLLSTMCV